MEEAAFFYGKNIVKTFGVVTALDRVDISINRGEVRGLIGENGSGKSTFSLISAGVQKPDSGRMFFDGSEYAPENVIDALEKGVGMIVQEQGTIGRLSVSANLFLGREEIFIRHGVLNVRKMNSTAAELLSGMGVTHIKPDEYTDTLTFEDRKIVEIARAMYAKPKLLIIDETTNALTAAGREILYRIIKQQREENLSVLFISHDVDEIMRVCDSITILRDGSVTANLKKEEFDENRIKQLMVGREMTAHYYRTDFDSSCGDQVVLSVNRVFTKSLKGISLQLHRGEILGIGGLTDCGMHEIGKVMFGLERPVKGTVIDFKGVVINSPKKAIRNSIGYISKNRDKEALMPVCSIRDNVCMPSLDDLSKAGIVTKKAEKLFALRWTEKLSIKMVSIDQFCTALSGGNKQKVVLAKWLGKNSDILILDCPTRGIDIGVKAAIYDLLYKLKESGKSILIISEELSELIGMSDRVLIVKDGRVEDEHKREERLTESDLIVSMI